MLASLFLQNGCYHKTPFSVQVGHDQIKQYWQRIEPQTDIALTFEILQVSALGGIAHWVDPYWVAKSATVSKSDIHSKIAIALVDGFAPQIISIGS